MPPAGSAGACSSSDSHLSSFDFVLSGGEDAEGLGEREMLLHLNAGVEGCGRVVLEDGDGFLDENRPRVRSGVDKVDGHARDLASVVERLGPGGDAGKRGEKD